jgi:hypothetical protein
MVPDAVIDGVLGPKRQIFLVVKFERIHADPKLEAGALHTWRQIDIDLLRASRHPRPGWRAERFDLRDASSSGPSRIFSVSDLQWSQKAT